MVWGEIVYLGGHDNGTGSEIQRHVAGEVKGLR